MICRGCGIEKKLIKAHIIPESFFRGLRDGQKAPKILSTTEGIHPKKAPIGVYDMGILCNDCEQIFKTLDDYGCHILINKESELETLNHDGQVVGYRIKDVDTSRLKLFFLSILWRASISTHHFYSKVALNSLEEKAKNLVWQSDSGGIHDFSFVLARFDGEGVDRTILDPCQQIWFDVKYYMFYLYGYILYIKADLQKTPSEWANFIPVDNSIIVVSRGKIKNSKEYTILLSVAQENKRT
jgi:hypothetical protein